MTDGKTSTVIRREPVTPEVVARLRAGMHGPHIDSLLDEIERGWRRERELLAFNNAELERRRRFEDEANQAYCELTLVRNECRRLREQLSLVGGWVEASGFGVPSDVAAAIIALFPEEGPRRPWWRRVFWKRPL